MARPRKTAYPDPLPGITHGTASGYNYHRCRCADCAAWMREIHAKFNERRKAELLNLQYTEEAV